MTYLLLKFGITAFLVVVVSEVSRRSSIAGGLLASLPLVSVLAMIWLYIDTGSVEKVGALATSVFWLVLPSLSLFILLPILLKKGIGFYLSLGVSTLVMVGLYALSVGLLWRFK